MESLAVQFSQPIRTHPSTPKILAEWLDALHDSIPSSAGFVVEGGELGRSPDSPFIAGVPQARGPIQLIGGQREAQLVRDVNRQSVCVAWRLNESGEMADSPALPTTIDSNNPLWAELVHLVMHRYPMRFQEIWVYLGPIYDPEASAGSPESTDPLAHYVIIFDMTEIGGLRALTLRLPAGADAGKLDDYITSIASIERACGIQFLPELDFSLRNALVEHVSPQIW